MDTIESYYSVLSRQQQDRISGVPAAASRGQQDSYHHGVCTLGKVGLILPAPLAQSLPKPAAHLPIPRAIGFPCGILFFVLTKQEVDKDRLKQMKARQNMRVSNTGEYESQRFRVSSQQAQFPEVGSGVQN